MSLLHTVLLCTRETLISLSSKFLQRYCKYQGDFPEIFRNKYPHNFIQIILKSIDIFLDYRGSMNKEALKRKKRSYNGVCGDLTESKRLSCNLIIHQWKLTNNKTEVKRYKGLGNKRKLALWRFFINKFYI